MFSYPQPTDEELSAQQPPYPPPINQSALTSQNFGHANAYPTTAEAGPSDVVTGQSLGLGRIAMILGIVATVLSVIASGILGGTVGPMEAEYGYYLSDTPNAYSNLAIVLLSLQGICTLLGLTGLIMGIFAIASNRGRTQGIIASVIAVLAPVISFGVFLIVSLVAVSLVL